MPPLAPPRPSPPVTPGLVYRHVVSTTITIAGEVSTFDAAAFTASLARLVGVDAKQITIEIAPASVPVTAHISTGSSSAAAAASASLSATSASLSESLGVDVEQVSAIDVQVQLVVRQPPPPALARSAGPAPSLPVPSPHAIWPVALGSSVAVALALGLGCFCLLRQRKHGRRLLALHHLESEEGADMRQLEYKVAGGSGKELANNAMSAKV